MVVSKSLRQKPGEQSLIAAVMEKLANSYPTYKSTIVAITPLAVGAGDVLDAGYTLFCRLLATSNALGARLESYDVKRLSYVLLGLFICFFGASFLMVASAVECVRLVVWRRLVRALQVLAHQYDIAAQASKQDDLVDDDKNGISDVNEITHKELLTRKIYLFLRTVNPSEVTEALGVLWAAVLSVIASLRAHTAQAITFGCSFGDVVSTHAQNRVEPVVVALLPEEMQQWTPVVIEYIFRIGGCIAAWWLMPFIAGIHTSTRGADIAVCNGIRAAREKGFLPSSFNDRGPQATAMTALVALTGFYWQFAHGFTLPLFVSLVLFPLSIAESLLRLLVWL